MAAVSMVACLLAACAPSPPPPAAMQRPHRIVSLDFCADQFVLKLADRDQIAAVSVDAVKNFSYMRSAATGLRTVRSRAEDALALSPDLVVRSYGGEPRIAELLDRAGVPVAQIGYAEDFTGIRHTIRDMARAVGQPQRGDALVAEMDARLARIAATGSGARSRALYSTPGGVTTGPGSLIHEIILASGLSNFETAPGWRPLPLEKLTQDQPDMIVAGLFGHTPYNPDLWSAARHPVIVHLNQTRPTVPIDGAWTACGGWFALDAVEALAAARR